jgi:beta-galactosidase
MMGFIMRPVKDGKFTETANVSSSSIAPIVVVRDRRGIVSMRCDDAAAEIYYQIGNGRRAKKVKYTEPVAMDKGGVLTVWDKNRSQMVSVYNYTPVTIQPISVKYASSQEIYEAAENIVDGDANTIWHTMYSVTVAQYPHWIDFDAGVLATGADADETAENLLQLVLDTASGKEAKNELGGYREISIFKDGVML